MTLCIESRVRSAASTNPRRAEEETPWDSGLLRGSSAPRPIEPLRTTSAAKVRHFMLSTSGVWATADLSGRPWANPGNRPYDTDRGLAPHPPAALAGTASSPYSRRQPVETPAPPSGPTTRPAGAGVHRQAPGRYHRRRTETS